MELSLSVLLRRLKVRLQVGARHLPEAVAPWIRYG
jgi:hypothetical protein